MVVKVLHFLGGRPSLLDSWDSLQHTHVRPKIFPSSSTWGEPLPVFSGSPYDQNKVYHGIPVTLAGVDSQRVETRFPTSLPPTFTPLQILIRLQISPAFN